MNLLHYAISQVYTYNLLEPFYVLDVKTVTLTSSATRVNLDSALAAQLIVGIAGDTSALSVVPIMSVTPLGDHALGSEYMNLSQTHGRITSWWQTVLILYTS